MARTIKGCPSGLRNRNLIETSVHTQLTHESTDFIKKQFPVSLVLHNFEIKLNIGSIFRLADAFGCEHIYLTGDTPRPPDRKITKTSRSAEKFVAYSYTEDPQDIIYKLKEQGYRVISLELTDKSISLADLQLESNEKICLMLGSEKVGVNQKLLDESDLTVHIPMYGHLSSLNVATAAGIALYAITSALKKE